MSSFDPASIRKAVDEFTPRRPQKFHDLLPAREIITELRQKHASYGSIADLLTQHCLPASKTAIAAFCHHVLGETVRPRRRVIRKQPGIPEISEASPPGEPGAQVNVTAHFNDEPRPRGPHIAQIRLAKPQSK
jgi:hypothetical protein